MESEIANIEAGLAAAAESRPDLAALAAAVESAQAAVGQGRAGRASPPKPRMAPRARTSTRARIPLADAERAVQRLDTEAKTLMKLLAVETESMWPPVIDKITVEKGYEIALGAALGDDLDAPVDPDPCRCAGWAPRSIRPIRRCRKARSRLPQHVQAPPELARRLAQIGVVERADGARLAAPAQARPAAGFARRRSVALGRLCRRRPCADRRRAPPGRSAAASPTSTANSSPRAPTLDDKRKAVEAAQSALTAAGAAEAAAREHWRTAQREADNARELHAMAEREMARNAARISALTEAKTRLVAGRDEAQAATRRRRDARSPSCRHPPSWSASSPTSAPRSKASARSSPRCAPRRRRWRARPSSPTAGSTPSAPTGRPGATAATAPSPRSRRSTPAAPRPGRSARRSPTRRRSSRRSAALLIGEVAGGGNHPQRRRRPSGRGRERARPPATARCAPRSKRSAPPARRPPRAEERVEGAKRRLTDIAHEIHEMLEIEPDARRAASPASSRTPRCRTSPPSKPSLNGCAATASGSAPSTCAPRRSWARSRPSTPR